MFFFLSPPFLLQTKRLGAGVIDGRSVWADDGTALRLVAALHALLGPDQAISVQSSTSLQHVPLDLTLDTNLPSTLVPRLAFSVQKLQEMVRVAQDVSKVDVKPLDLATYSGAPGGGEPVTSDLAEEMFHRPEPYATRRPKQVAFHAFPTTTIGSFPQTAAIRKARLQFKKGQLSAEEYRERMAAEIAYAVGVQDALGLDVLVHGEREFKCIMIVLYSCIVVGAVDFLGGGVCLPVGRYICSASIHMHTF